MSFKRFAEFLSEQQKGSKMPGATEQPLGKKSKLPTQYHAKGAKQDRGLVTADDDRGAPLGEKGMSGMTPKNVMPYGQKPAGAPKKLKSSKGKMPKKMKTEAFLNETSDLSNAQFTATLLENQSIPKPKIHSLEGRQYTPEPAETLRYVVSMALQNEAMMSRLVREVKRNGGLESLVNELFNHGETFAVIAEAAAGSTRINRKLNEAVAEPRSMSGGGGSPAGPNGASAGNGPIVKNGGGMGATPPGPPSEGGENPDNGGNLLDDEGGGDEEDDNSEDDDELDLDGDGEDDEEEDDDDEGDEGKHTHIHVHNHHHHGSKGGDMGGDDMGGDDMGMGKPKGGGMGMGKPKGGGMKL